MMYYNTVTPALKELLVKLMQASVFNPFRLVGGTSLSLQLGHRKSGSIVLFTDEKYASIHVEEIDRFLKSNFVHIKSTDGILPGMGKSYNVEWDGELIKLDVFYSNEKFIRTFLLVDGIRLATMEEIIAMKLDVVADGGRKKDFWDLHELTPRYSLPQMLALHKERNPYIHDAELITRHFSQFEKADQDFDPVCLRGKYWELIKQDLVEFVKG